jgi:hypothetical protein
VQGSIATCRHPPSPNAQFEIIKPQPALTMAEAFAAYPLRRSSLLVQLITTKPTAMIVLMAAAFFAAPRLPM